MNFINKIFASVYSLVLMVSVWFGINWILTRGLSSMADDSTEFIFAVLYFLALLFSIFMHIKLRNNVSLANRICTIVTLINMILLTGIAILAFNSINADGLFLVVWMFIILGIWFISLISGIIALM